MAGEQQGRAIALRIKITNARLTGRDDEYGSNTEAKGQTSALLLIAEQLGLLNDRIDEDERRHK